MKMSEDELRKKLTPEQYDVLVKKSTEAPFSGEYDTKFEDGTYKCAACGQELFESGTKFDAHCGWPSFHDAKEGAVRCVEDSSHGMQRTEVICGQCGGHLGHVFEGETNISPTGTRYCINSLSLQFDPDSK